MDTVATEHSASVLAGPLVCDYHPTDLRQSDLLYSRFRQLRKTFFLFIWSVGPKRSVNPSSTALWKSSCLRMYYTYLLTCIIHRSTN